jgi:hypothetical protein
MNKNTRTITFSATEDFLRALDVFARYHNRSRAKAIETVVKFFLIKFPGHVLFLGFPSDQSLCGWVKAKLREASGHQTDLPEHAVDYNGCPLPDVGLGRKLPLRVALDEDIAEALSLSADETYTSRSRIVFSMVRAFLISTPAHLHLPEFPRWQQLALWVGAHIQARHGMKAIIGDDERHPTFSPWERFGLAPDGKTVIAFDRVTAG